jgi:hypothetical protein
MFSENFVVKKVAFSYRFNDNDPIKWLDVAGREKQFKL